MSSQPLISGFDSINGYGRWFASAPRAFDRAQQTRWPLAASDEPTISPVDRDRPRHQGRPGPLIIRSLVVGPGSTLGLRPPAGVVGFDSPILPRFMTVAAPYGPSTTPQKPAIRTPWGSARVGHGIFMRRFGH